MTNEEQNSINVCIISIQEKVITNLLKMSNYLAEINRSNWTSDKRRDYIYEEYDKLSDSTDELRRALK